MKNNSFLTSLSKDLVRDVRDLMAGNSSVESPLEELGEAAKVLSAKQKKIDKNHNGKLDAEDFAKLRNEGIDRVVIHSPYTPDIHGGLAEVTHRDLRTGVVTVMFENMYYKLKKGQFTELPEEFEQLDELSKKTLGSYINKAQGKQVDAGYAFAKSYGKDNKKENDAIRSVGNKSIGISRAVKKLAKEETEELDELSKSTLGSYINKASGKMAQSHAEVEKARHDRNAVHAIDHATSGTSSAVRNAVKDIVYDDARKRENKHFKDVVKRNVGIGRAVGKLTKEETEELDELSKSTLGSYIKKAAPSAIQKGIDYGVKKAERDEMDRNMNRYMSFSDKDKIHDIMKTTHKDVDKPREKALRRNQGIVRATNRLTKEEVEELDEASSYSTATKNAEASRQRAIKKAAAAYKRHGDMDRAIRDHDLFAKDAGKIKAMCEEVEELDEKTAYQPKMVKHPISGKMVPEDSFIPPKTMPKDKYNPVIGGPESKEKKNMISAFNKPKNKNEKPNAYYKEEVEELDEISAGMAQSYLQKKRERDYNTSSDGTTHTLKKPTTLNRLNKDIKGTVRALRTIEKTKNEEVEELDELRGATIKSYIKKANKDKAEHEKQAPSHDREWNNGKFEARPNSNNKTKFHTKELNKRSAGLERAYNKMAEEVELSQDEIDNIEAILADLDEGRGRPPKEGSDAWKRRQTQAADDVPALGIQLRKAASINKPVTFANGESKDIHRNHIERFNDHMDARKTSQDKANFQKTANKSHADFVKAVTADIPNRAKDTGEIVKYGK